MTTTDILTILACPICFSKLDLIAEALNCEECSNKFHVNDNIPVMLLKHMLKPTGNRIPQNIVLTEKESIQDLYDTASESIKSDAMARFSKFLNYGYVSNENHQYAQPAFNNPSVLLNKNSIKLLGEVIGSLNLSNIKILEVGCGRGGNLQIINKYFKPRISIGLDLSYGNILFCKDNNKYNDTLFIVGDAENMPFSSNSFDVILNIESALHYPNVNQFFDSAYRVLNRNGMFLYADIIPTAELDKRERYFSGLGFSIERKTDISSNVLLSMDVTGNKSTFHSNLSSGNNQQNSIRALLESTGNELYQTIKNGLNTYIVYNLVKQ